MTPIQATEYITEGILEGIYNADMFEGYTEEDLIEFAETEGFKGDFYANE